MAYQKQTWKNLPNQTTPITAERLNHMEDGIYDASTATTVTINNTYSTANDEVYSCNYVNGINDYSTDEVFTGKYWIDGKPIYRKALVINNLPNNTYGSYAHSISNIDLIYIEKAFWSLSDGACGPIPQYFSSSEITNIYVNKTTVNISTNVNYSPRKGYVVLEYTKTTD